LFLTPSAPACRDGIG